MILVMIVQVVNHALSVYLCEITVSKKEQFTVGESDQRVNHDACFFNIFFFLLLFFTRRINKQKKPW